MPPPKKKISVFATRRKHLMWYLDHYRFLFKGRRAHFDRARYQDAMYKENYAAPAFRYPGFWPGSFGFHRSQALLKDELKASVSTSEGAPAGPAPRSWRQRLGLGDSKDAADGQPGSGLIGGAPGSDEARRRIE
eukprot:gnl/TRDRNA2_/TRDRNA2_45357_c0_seq1.p1 gnl/TRDRNA2_/TRDRNA2_45357_c0~~gnl/TRDRNA2_/TRDRNA2_45357_c0_seq1.p1  ORF type:complete len:154 (+),score=25.32 gnl/TRDRNA2_/TRDRNA2_45357_c0_seq1:62-463(+)